MVVYSNRFLDIETLPASEQKKFKASELFVLDGTHTVRLLDLYVLEKKNPDGTNKTRRVRSVYDFKTNLNKSNNIFAKADASWDSHIDDAAATIMIERISIPSIYTSHSIDKTGATDSEKVPRGLKRTLEVEKANVGEGKYVYVFIGDEGKFLLKDKVFWLDGTKKKTYEDAIAAGVDLTTIQFFDEFDRNLSGIYTEYEYKFSKVLARERANLTDAVDIDSGLPAFTVRNYEIDDEGNVRFTERAVEKFVSDQKFITEEVDDERKPGKKKKVSKIKYTNYSLSSSGEFVAVTIDDEIRMVKISDLVDKDGNDIVNIKDMVGEVLLVKQDDRIIASTKPLTYEQANLTYESIKTYQKSDGLPSETSCLRLTDGSYVKELDAVQPISYKLTDDAAVDFDKFLVAQTIDGVTKYVVVDKDYFLRKGSSAGFDTTKVKKLVRCDFCDTKCDVIQTTSQKEPVEQCALLKSIKFGTDIVPKADKSKSELFKAFKISYEQDKYVIEDVYISGKRVEIAKGDKRYEYSSESYRDDHASNLHDYKSMKTKDISIKDGKIVGGAKYNVGRAISDSYTKWGKALLAGVTIVPVAGIFVPILAPLVAVYGVGVLAAAPLIPIVNAGIGAVKNNPLRKVIKYQDKTEHNRKKQASEIHKELKSLVERRDLNQKQFEDIYAKIMNEISMFAKTTSNNSLVVVNGEAEVNENNANLANQYVADYNKAKKEYEYYKKKIEALTKKGKPIPAVLQEAYDLRKAEFEALLNTTRGQSYEEDGRLEMLQNEAASIKLYYYIKNYPDSDLVRGLSDDLVSKLEYDARKGIMIDGISIDSSEKAIERKFKKDSTKVTAWKLLKTEALAAIESAKEVESDKPIEGDVKDKWAIMEKLKAVVRECELSFNSVVDAAKDYEADYALINTYKLLSTAVWDDIQTMADTETTESVDDIKALIDAITDKNELLKEHLLNVNEAKRIIEQIKTKTEEFDQVVSLIEAACLGVADYAKKTTFLATLESYKNNVNQANNEAKFTMATDDLNDKLTNINSAKELTDELLEEINALGDEKERMRLADEIKAIYESVTAVIDSLNSTEVKKALSSVILILTNNKRLIKEFEMDARADDAVVSQAVILKNKALRVAELIKVSVESLMVLEKVKQSAKAETQSYVGRLIGEMTNYIRVNKDTTIAQLQENVRLAREKYEREILPFLLEIEEKEKKKLEKKKKASEAAAEASSEIRVDMVRLEGEKQIRNKLNILLSDRNAWSEADQQIYEALLTRTNLSEKDLFKKMSNVRDKLSININESKNSKFRKGNIPFIIVDTIAEALHLDRKMFEMDPNQYSMF